MSYTKECVCRKWSALEDEGKSKFYMAGEAEILCTILKLYQKFKLLQPIKGVHLHKLFKKEKPSKELE